MSEIKRIAVAVIRRGEKFLIQKRPEGGHLAGVWEFPGGKIEAGESVEQALERECREELDCAVNGTRLSETIEHEYPEFKVELHPLLCSINEDDEPKCHAASEQRWVTFDDLKEYKMPPANKILLEVLRRRMLENK